jgi:hypothetical protein
MSRRRDKSLIETSKESLWDVLGCVDPRGRPGVDGSEL